MTLIHFSFHSYLYALQAHELGQQDESEEELVLTEDERVVVEAVRKVWAGILKIGVEDDTDFFGAGAGSMDVVRLIEEVKEEVSDDGSKCHSC